MLVAEERRQQILDKLSQERQIRRELIEQGRPQAYLDHGIVVVERPQPTTNAINVVTTNAINVVTTNAINVVTINDEDLTQSLSYSTEPPQPRRDQRLIKMKQDLFSATKKREFCERLAQPKPIQQRLAEKQDREDKEFEQACTFQPQISEASKQISLMQQPAGDLLTRFDVLERDRLQHIDNLKQAQNQSQMFVAQPITPSQHDHVPLHLRLAQVVKQKQNLLADLHADYLKEEQFDFQPLINAQSEVIAMIKNDGEDVVQRLTKMSKHRTNSDAQDYSFQPNVNSLINFEVVGRLGLSDDFLERQQQLSRIQSSRLSILEEQNAPVYTFQPKLNAIAEIKYSRNSNMVDRLYSDEIDRRQESTRMAQQAQDNLYAFAPTLNKHSKALAADRCFQDLVSDDTTRKELLRSRAEEQQREEYSFYPTTNFSNIQSPYTFDNCHETIQKQMDQKEKVRREQLKRKEALEVQQCTFKPQTNKRIMGLTQPMQEVNGVESYMIKVDLQRRKKQEQQHREEKMFEKHKQYDYGRHSHETKQQPFRLSEKPTKKSYAN